MKTSKVGSEIHKAAEEYQVLYVEPNADCRALVEVLLGVFGYVVISVCNADAAKEILRGGLFDAYILDTRLPSQNGFDLCRHICEIDETAQVLFYACTVGIPDIIKGFEAGATEFLTMPYGVEILPQVLSDLIKHKKRLRVSLTEKEN